MGSAAKRLPPHVLCPHLVNVAGFLLVGIRRSRARRTYEECNNSRIPGLASLGLFLHVGPVYLTNSQAGLKVNLPLVLRQNIEELKQSRRDNSHVQSRGVDSPPVFASPRSTSASSSPSFELKLCSPLGVAHFCAVSFSPRSCQTNCEAVIPMMCLPNML